MNKDTLLKEAFEIILKNNMASVSLIQRRLKIGYNRSSRIIDQLEDMGAIGGFNGVKPRTILVRDISKLDFN